MDTILRPYTPVYLKRVYNFKIQFNIKIPVTATHISRTVCYLKSYMIYILLRCVFQEHKVQISVAENFTFENTLQKSVKFGNSSYEGKIEGRIEGRVR